MTNHERAGSSRKTKKQIRVEKQHQAQIARIEAKKRESRSKRLKKIAVAGGLGTILTLSGVAGLGKYQDYNKSEFEKFDSQDAAARQKAVQEIIGNEIKGQIVSQKEIELWQNSYLYNPNIYYPLTEESSTTVSERLYGTLDLMMRSENPEYKLASQYLFEKVNSGEISFSFVPGIGDDQATSLAASFYLNDQGVLAKELVVPFDFILNRSNAGTLAGTVVHEVEHFKRFQGHIDNLPSGMSDMEKFIQLEEYSEENLPLEEAYAYARAAQAYINQAALFGEIRTIPISGEEDRAAAFILAGKNPLDPDWLGLIEGFESDF